MRQFAGLVWVDLFKQTDEVVIEVQSEKLKCNNGKSGRISCPVLEGPVVVYLERNPGQNERRAGNRSLRERGEGLLYFDDRLLRDIENPGFRRWDLSRRQ